MKRLWLLVGLVSLTAASVPAFGDEGMWTFDNFPTARVQQALGSSPNQAWLDHARLSTARLDIGCSSGLVSGQGLLQTNAHCVIDCAQGVSPEGQHYDQSGFVAESSAEEKRCPGYAAEILTQITDVTQRINQATAAVSGEAFTRTRDAEISRIESACKGRAANKHCEVVTLYQGGQYKLYAYHRYDDLRLVFAPEYDAAFFGGDPDNFNFPRYDFDVGFLRLYENDRPAQTPQHLTWRSTPMTDNEPTYVVGNPGTTSRLFTTAQMAFLRDNLLPWRMATYSDLRGRMLQFAQQSPENAAEAAETLLYLENDYKVFYGEHEALIDPAIFDTAARRQGELQQRVAANPQLAHDVGNAWEEIAHAEQAYRGFYIPHQLVGRGPNSDLFTWARDLVRAGSERAKPDAERLPEFSEARLPAIRQQIEANAPVHAALEEIQLGFWLSKTREYLTADDPLSVKILGRESPEELAHRLVTTTHLGDPAVRRQLYEGGAAAIAASTDPMIVFVRNFYADARALRRREEQEVEGPITSAQQRIARARFQIYGTSDYPDATFTPRVSYGHVQGFTTPGGRVIAPFTRFGGLYQRATGAEPFKLAPHWAAAQSRLNAQTIFDYSTNNDIVGGNSGSPVLDAQGRVVGAAFDGNIYSLGGYFVFDPTLNRTVVVSSTAIEEALVKVYGAQRIVNEIKH